MSKKQKKHGVAFLTALKVIRGKALHIYYTFVLMRRHVINYKVHRALIFL